jgi:glycosyltransferase involved in cell wall biosynthesis
LGQKESDPQDDVIHIADLPPPPPGKTGYPWTTGTAIPTISQNVALPKITLVTPSFKQGQYLEETIRSVLLQGYPNLEYMVIDGDSPDESKTIIRKYEKFLTYWVSEKDSGQTNAINKGFTRATGQVMGWLNSDDVLMPGALLTIGREFAHNPKTQVLCGLRVVIDSQSQVAGHWITEMPTRFVLQHLCVVPQETCYWRRSVYERIGPLDETFRFAMDFDYWQRMLKAGYEFRLIPRFLGKFRVHGEAKTSTLRDVMEQEVSRIYAMHLGRQATVRQMADELRNTPHPHLPFVKRFRAEKFASAPLLALNLALRDRYYKLTHPEKQ